MGGHRGRGVTRRQAPVYRWPGCGQTSEFTSTSRALAAEHPEHLADHGEARVPVRLEGDAGHVGRHDDARQVEQGTVERARLLLEHVQAGGAELPGDQGLEYARRGSRESRPPCACLRRPRPPLYHSLDLLATGSKPYGP